MGANDELKPLVGSGFGYGRFALLIGLAGGTYCFSTVPVLLAVIAQHKAGLTSHGLSKGEISSGQSFFWLGWAASSVFVLPCVDRFGRKMPYVGLLALGLTFTCVGTLANTAFVYALAVFFVGTALPNAAMVGYLLLTESVPTHMRSVTTGVINVLYSCVSILIAVVGGTAAKDLPWQTETLLWHIPFLCIFFLAPIFLSESPEFRKDMDEAASAEPKQQGPLAQLFGTPALLGRLGASCVCWGSVTVGFYGLSYSAGSISDNFYANLALLSLVDIITYGLAITIIQPWGARLSQLVCFSAAGLAMVVAALVPAGWWRIAVCLFGRFMFNVAFTTIYILLTELFPAECRGTASGLANGAGRLLGFCTPFLEGMHMGSVSAIMFILCFLAAAATWTMPATPPAGPALDLPLGGERSSERRD